MAKATRQAGKPHTATTTQERAPVPGSLALALINTVVLDRGEKRDRLSSPDDLACWWEAVCKDHPDECAIRGAGEPITWTSDLLEAVKALRMALRTLLTHVVEQHAVVEEDLQPVNAVLARGYAALERTAHGHVKVVARLRESEQGSVLVPIALSALRLFTESDWRRLHQCQSDRCIIFFYDTTRSGTRRWCTPDCMNRARSIRHYQMTKKKAALQ